MNKCLYYVKQNKKGWEINFHIKMSSKDILVRAKTLKFGNDILKLYTYSTMNNQ